VYASNPVMVDQFLPHCTTVELLRLPVALFSHAIGLLLSTP